MTASRYEGVPTRTVLLPDGTEVRYRAPRRVPREPIRPAARIPRSTGERIDLLASQLLGSPAGWWILCDASGVLVPAELEHDDDPPAAAPYRPSV